MAKRLLAISFLFFLLSTCIPTQPTLVPTQSIPSKPTQAPLANWWEDAVFYEIFVRSFYDTDGNGIGDFQGVTQKLNYLQNLGITAIWLMPIHPSPSYHGYDVTDYYSVNPEYGTMDDFKNLLKEAHERDIRIIIDLILNHTSSEHPFFVEANRDVDSRHRDWYIWSDTSRGQYWHPGSHGFYYGFFSEGMPDLNYRNPEVTAEMFNVTRFWLKEVGVDGFRIDAAKHLIEEGEKIENTQSTHDWYKEFYEYYKSSSSGAYTVGEAFGAGAFIAKTYQNQFDHLFNFELASGFLSSVRTGTNTPVNSAIKFTLKDDPHFHFATFLTNHDQDRVMSVLEGDIDKAKVAAFLLLTSPGTPFIYYGEEIGMQGRKPDEDIRRPMQWSSEENAGFTTAVPWRAPASDYPQVNVAAQENDPDALLPHYRELIRLRRETPALRSEQLALVETANPGVYAALRTSADQKLLVMINLTGTPISAYQLSLNESLLSDGTFTPHSLLGKIDVIPVTISGGKFSDYKPVNKLLPYQPHIFEIE